MARLSLLVLLAALFAFVVQAADFKGRKLQFSDFDSCDDLGAANDCEFEDADDCDSFQRNSGRYASCLVRACGKDAIDCETYNGVIGGLAELAGCDYEDVSCTILPIGAIVGLAVAASIIAVAGFFLCRRRYL
mmetsp:Transcript_7439/g.8550  ORF Transcript_7439/g.8550 Transcript_7439/m.8550 type:complete len:133 (+) Transcript_7439:274-672(+)|eukprot:CAMPEP_0184036518 /NCGR_PEP_ID=MMETSP0955-20130417/32967_1 /TAXON_ID=627963 /ORGANISM="Aplanochytrium sp, Strain PBS07" /LENGTH=132 /DNA_ID=CAMNT_0026324199 /DNA_START=189 /DNA_END=587 /DNA_ORIENTATION=+